MSGEGETTPENQADSEPGSATGRCPLPSGNQTASDLVLSSMLAEAEDPPAPSALTLSESVSPFPISNVDSEEVKMKPKDDHTETVMEPGEPGPGSTSCSVEKEENLGSQMFATPVYRQRYSRITEILRNEHVKSVVDFGVAECKTLPQYRSVSGIEKIVGVDIDRNVLEMHHFLTKPLTTDFIAPRDNPLWMALFHGSVADYDSRLADFDAMVMIEVIEHLEPDVLAKFPHAVFGEMNPRLIIVTTPNSDFNVLFPNFTGMRHWDHKFEWSREEFKEWCEDVCRTYQYTAEYQGIGEGPEGTLHLGCCSQMAVFRRLAEGPHRNPPGDHRPYSLVTECHHPYRENTLTPAEEAAQEAVYYMQMLARQRQLDREQFEPAEEELPDNFDEEESETEIDLQDLLRFPRMSKLCSSVDELREAMKDGGHRLTDDETRVIFRHGLGHHSSSSEEDGLWVEDKDDIPPVSNETDGQDISPWPTDAVEENWDEDWGASGDAGNQQNDSGGGPANSDDSWDEDQDEEEEEYLEADDEDDAENVADAAKNVFCVDMDNGDKSDMPKMSSQNIQAETENGDQDLPQTVLNNHLQGADASYFNTHSSFQSSAIHQTSTTTDVTMTSTDDNSADDIGNDLSYHHTLPSGPAEPPRESNFSSHLSRTSASPPSELRRTGVAFSPKTVVKENMSVETSSAEPGQFSDAEEDLPS